jgi:hypothetical protein
MGLKFHEVLYSLALESQRFDAEIPPEAVPIVEFGLKAVQKARTFAEFHKAMQAMPPPGYGEPVAPDGKRSPTFEPSLRCQRCGAWRREHAGAELVCPAPPLLPI